MYILHCHRLYVYQSCDEQRWYFGNGEGCILIYLVYKYFQNMSLPEFITVLFSFPASNPRSILYYIILDMNEETSGWDQSGQTRSGRRGWTLFSYVLVPIIRAKTGGREDNLHVGKVRGVCAFEKFSYLGICLVGTYRGKDNICVYYMGMFPSRKLSGG